ncbi:MAG: response regulator [Flavobacteriales bacterium]
MKRKIKIAIADDQQLFAQGLEKLLKAHENFNVLFSVPNGKELISKVKDHMPDVILMDLQMPEMDGMDATLKLRSLYIDLKIIALTMHNEEDFIIDMIEKGANGFLSKDTDIEMLIDAIYTVMDNEYYFNEKVSKALVKGLVRSKKVKPRFNAVQLTPREIEVIQLICKEKTNQEIAVELCISVRTVDGHREMILQKTGARNTAGIVMYAVRHNLLG